MAAVMLQDGFILGGARILRRAWQLYVAFVFLSVIYIAEIAYIAGQFDNPLFVEEMNVLHFLRRPEVVLIEVLRLRFLVANVDVLPIYIVLMLAFPMMLWLLLRSPYFALAISFAIYLAAKWWGWNLTVYPVGQEWFFNPFAWQFLFMIGAWCAVGGAKWLPAFCRSNLVAVICLIYLSFALWLATTSLVPGDHSPPAELAADLAARQDRAFATPTQPLSCLGDPGGPVRPAGGWLSPLPLG